MQVNYTKYINIVALGYALVLPVSRAGISFLTIVLMLLWFLEGGFKNKLAKLSKNKIILTLFVFLIFNLISTLWTENIIETLDYVKKYWYFFPILIFYTSLSKEYLPKVLTAFILGMFASELIAYGVFFELWQFKHATPDNPSPFMHHIEYSVFLAFTALMLLSRLFNEGDIKTKLTYFLFFTTISGNLFLTAGRTGRIAFVLGLFVLAMMSFKNKFKAIGTFTLISVVVLTVAFNMSCTFKERVLTAHSSLTNVVNAQNYCSSWGSRVGACVVAKDIIKENPLLGAGIMDNMKELHFLIDTKYPEMKCIQSNLMHMHNQYVQVFTELGLIGFIIFIAIFYQVGRLKIGAQEYSNMKYIYLTVLLFSFVSEVIFHRQFSMALFALITGLLLVQYREENEV